MGLPPGLAPPGHPSYPYDPLALAAQQQHDIYVREAALRQGLDMQRWIYLFSSTKTNLTNFSRMVDSQRLESMRAAEARANSFLNPYSKGND